MPSASGLLDSHEIHFTNAQTHVEPSGYKFQQLEIITGCFLAEEIY